VRDVRVQAGAGAGRWGVSPDGLDEAVGGHHPPRLEQQGGQQGTLLGAADVDCVPVASHGDGTEEVKRRHGRHRVMLNETRVSCASLGNTHGTLGRSESCQRRTAGDQSGIDPPGMARRAGDDAPQWAASRWIQMPSRLVHATAEESGDQVGPAWPRAGFVTQV
jgi:hypothetical protein